MRIKKKLLVVAVALIMCFVMCPVAHASSGDLTITAVLPDNTEVPFTNDAVQVNATYGTSTAYFSYAQLPDTTTFTSVQTKFGFEDYAVRINGDQYVYNNSPVTVNFSSAVTVEVLNSLGTTIRTYYVSAFRSTFEATMQFEYNNAVQFASLTAGSTYGTSNYLKNLSQTEIDTMGTAVSGMNTMCGNMSPAPGSTNHSWLNQTVSAGDTPYDLLCDYRDHFTGFYFSGSSTYIDSIGTLNYNSTGRYSGGWMYQVIRDGVTYTPLIGINGWKLIPGDTVIWRYTCDYGYDIGAPMW